jgi:hypothetical protein
MNINTGEVLPNEQLRRMFASPAAARDAGFVPVPRQMEEEAAKHIASGEPVDLTGNSRLAQYAAFQRKRRRRA